MWADELGLDMKYILDEMFAFRFFEKKDGPFVSLRQFGYDEVSEIGKKAGISNIHDIFNNRVMIEDLLMRQFKRQGGVSTLPYPYYATVFDELPASNQLHVRFSEPQCLKIPMREFPKDQVSFTYGQSPRALTRKDNHPTRRKVMLWDEAEWAINTFPFIDEEGTWLEMQIWEDDTLKRFYGDGKGDCITDFVVEGRLGSEEREELVSKYSSNFSMLSSDLFFSPTSVHGLSHARRVMVLADVLADKCKLDNHDKKLLKYAAAFHDIGRLNHKEDEEHGVYSYRKAVERNLFPSDLSKEDIALVRFAIEEHPKDYEKAKYESDKLRNIDKNHALKLLSIIKDADTLDRCRFGNVDITYLINNEAKTMVNFGYQLLTIYPEILN